jgi:hypothetical protein
MAADIADPPRSFASDAEPPEPDEAPHRLLSADRVDGVAVYDRLGEKVAIIADVAVDEVTGEVAYAILSHGGFLGLGRRYQPVPWSVLHYDPRRDGYVLPLDRRTLESGPTYEAKSLSGWNDASPLLGLRGFVLERPRQPQGLGTFLLRATVVDLLRCIGRLVERH